MLRLLAACSLCLAAALPTVSAAGDRVWHSRFEHHGQAISTQWSATDSFSGLTLASGDRLTVSRGDRWQIRASGDPAVLAELRFIVDDGEIVIGRRNGRHARTKGLAHIEVIAPSLKSVALAGSGDIAVDRLTGPIASLRVAGSGTLSVERLDVKQVNAKLAGSGDLDIAGRAGAATIAIAGSGDILASRLAVTDATVTVAGSGDAAFAASGTVNASIVGSGDVHVVGTRDCTQKRMGSGRLRCTG